MYSVHQPGAIQNSESLRSRRGPEPGLLLELSLCRCLGCLARVDVTRGSFEQRFSDRVAPLADQQHGRSLGHGDQDDRAGVFDDLALDGGMVPQLNGVDTHLKNLPVKGAATSQSPGRQHRLHHTLEPGHFRPALAAPAAASAAIPVASPAGALPRRRTRRSNAASGTLPGTGWSAR